MRRSATSSDTSAALDAPAPSYAENRRVLREIADRLRTETDLDIDELIPLIDQASAAYRACRERVDAVERLIADRLPHDHADGEHAEDDVKR